MGNSWPLSEHKVIVAITVREKIFSIRLGSWLLLEIELHSALTYTNILQEI